MMPFQPSKASVFEAAGPCRISSPAGTIDNSLAIHRWGKPAWKQVPPGTKEKTVSSRAPDHPDLSSLAGLLSAQPAHPPMNRWAFSFALRAGLNGVLPLETANIRLQKRGIYAASTCGLAQSGGCFDAPWKVG